MRRKRGNFVVKIIASVKILGFDVFLYVRPEIRQTYYFNIVISV